MNDLTDHEAAERLGVTKKTLVTWLAELPIPHVTDDDGRTYVAEDVLAVLEAVKGMRAYDIGFQTIRRHLQAEAPAAADPAAAGAAAEQAQAEVAAEDVVELPAAFAPHEVTLTADPLPALDVPELIALVASAMEPLHRQLAELNGEQSRAMTDLARQLGRAESDHDWVRRDRERLIAELAAAHARISRLEAEAAARAAEDAERARPTRWELLRFLLLGR